MYDRYIKRLMDLVISLCDLIVLSPFFLILSIIIYIDDPGPVIFTQRRVGLDKSVRGKMILPPHGKEFFTRHGKEFFT